MVPRLALSLALPLILLSACADLPTGGQSRSIPVVERENLTHSLDQARSQAVARGMAPLASEELGYYMDVQEARLRQQLKANDLEVGRNNGALIIHLPGALTFAADSARLSAEVKAPLRGISEILSEFDRSLVVLHGHADDSGEDDYNRRLSTRRAEAVARFLQTEGLARDRLLVVGHGEASPLADNTTEQGRALNRRVELVVEPIVARN